MIEDFAEYWTETNHSNTRMRFELKRAWNTSRRLAKWTKMDDVYHPLPNTKHHAYNTRHAYTNHHAYYTHHGYYTHQRRTSADYIREAQEQAIIENEKFIREAERLRGGAPPHLPF